MADENTVLGLIVAHKWGDIKSGLTIGNVDEVLAKFEQKKKGKVFEQKPESELLDQMLFVLDEIGKKNDIKLMELMWETLCILKSSPRFEPYKNTLDDCFKKTNLKMNLVSFFPSHQHGKVVTLKTLCNNFIKHAPESLMRNAVKNLLPILSDEDLTSDQKIKKFQQDFEKAFKDQLPLYLTLPVVGDFCRAVLNFFGIDPIDIVETAEKTLTLKNSP